MNVHSLSYNSLKSEAYLVVFFSFQVELAVNLEIFISSYNFNAVAGFFFQSVSGGKRLDIQAT